MSGDTERSQPPDEIPAESGDLQTRYAAALAQLDREHEAAVAAALKEHDDSRNEITSAAEAAIEQIKSETEQVRQRLIAEYDAAVRELQRGLRELREKIHEQQTELRNLESVVRGILRQRYCRRKLRDLTEPEGKCESTNPVDAFALSLANARQVVRTLNNQQLPAVLNIFVLLMVAVFMVTCSTMAAGLLGEAAEATVGESSAGSVNITPSLYLVFATTGAVVLGSMAIAYVVLRPRVVSQTRDGYARFLRHVANARFALDVVQKLRAAEADIKRLARQQQRSEQIRKREFQDQQRIQQIATERDDRLRNSVAALQAQLQHAAEQREARRRAVREQFKQLAPQLRPETTSQLQQFPLSGGQGNFDEPQRS